MGRAEDGISGQPAELRVFCLRAFIDEVLWIIGMTKRSWRMKTWSQEGITIRLGVLVPGACYFLNVF